MIQGCATLIVDLGNSSTKCCVKFGKDNKTGLLRERSFELSNQFGVMSDPNYRIPTEDYDASSSTVLQVETELGGHTISGRFCNGELQKNEFPFAIVKPTGASEKYLQDSTPLSYRLAFYHATKTVMSMQRCFDFSQIDISWKVITLLPPGDMEKGTQEIEKIIKDINEVECVYPELSLPIKISSVSVLPEGYCAYAACVFDNGQVFREDYKYLMDSAVLILDIGAGTTDVLLVKKNKLVQNSKTTIQQGGNNVDTLVRAKLRMQGLAFQKDEVQEAVVSGYIMDGTSKVDIVDIINNSKLEIAQKIISELQDFFEGVDISPRSIGYILICGGGSMSSSTDERICPLSVKIAEVMKTFAPNAGLVELPRHIVTKQTEDGTFEKVEEQISPRDLNLVGASILSEGM